MKSAARSRLVEAHNADLLLLGFGENVDARALYRVLRRTHKARPDLVTIAFIEREDRVVMDAALAGGAFWCVDRRLGADELVRHVCHAYAGNLHELGVIDKRSSTRARLTRRELEILRLIAEGRPNREVAKILWVTDQTIRFHLANTYKKLHVRNRIEAIHWAKARGLVPPNPPDDGPGPAGVSEPRRPIKPSRSGEATLAPTEEDRFLDLCGDRESHARAAA